MVLKSILVAVSLPPVSFLWLAILGWLTRGRRYGHLMAGLGLGGLFVLGLPVVSGALIGALERGLPLTPPPDAPPKAIVILGGDIERVPNPPYALPGGLTLDRLRAGAALHRQTGLPILVTGGVVQPDRPAVARVMAESLRNDFQVPVEWVEDQSYDTWENATMSAAILQPRGIGSVYLVTDGWHMPRSLMSFRKAGLTATAAPATLTMPFDPILEDFIPRVSAWRWSYLAMHEWVGLVRYSFH